MKRTRIIFGLALLVLLSSKGFTQDFKTNAPLISSIEKNFLNALGQYKLMMKSLADGQFPKTYNTRTGALETSNSSWWCSGFYPGTLLKIYEETKDPTLLTEAKRMLVALSKEQFNKGTHDLGFMMYCSFGNALKVERRPEYKDILLNSARSLSSRFDPNVGCIRSWDSKKNEFVVIIDNMMNLELLFWATRETGDSSYYKIAVKHANTTMKNHFRSDFSSYHVIDYNPQTGAVQKKHTAQGYSDESAWARGQAWGLYGYTVMYRETHDRKYLEQAIHIAQFILSHPNLPKDKIPYWDFNAPDIPNALRDASAGAITASALLELCHYTNEQYGKLYFNTAESILRSLSASPYQSLPGTNGGFLLQHSVGHLPQKSEVDQPLSYADYYFVEAMQRYKTVNDFRPGQIWADNNGVHINAHGGGMMFNKGSYYWFGEHKVGGEGGNKAEVGVHCYSSKDLINWKDEGIALNVSQDPNSEITKGCILERPKVVYNKLTKKYVMWFHLELAGKGYNAARSGVAASDKPAGPYTYLKSYRPNAGKMPVSQIGANLNELVNCSNPKSKAETFFCRDLPGGQMARDMTIFLDDDGKAYHVYSSEENFTLQLAELTPDYTSHTGKYIRIYAGQQTEAPALFKRNGKYFMIGSGCTGWDPNAARAFSADSIWGPWTYIGNPCKGPAAELTYGGQSTHVLQVAGKKDAFIFMADKWTPKNAIDGRYLWLPISFQGDEMSIKWLDNWSLNVFDKK
jgi:unsaturated chondroitin disaccharide hydrolase